MVVFKNILAIFNNFHVVTLPLGHLNLRSRSADPSFSMDVVVEALHDYKTGFNSTKPTKVTYNKD